MLDVQAAVFGRNEAKRIEACLGSLCASIGTRRAQVTVVLNGCTDGSPAIARAFAARSTVPIRVCLIEHADKSNAINQFHYALRHPARMYVGVDAYATMNPGAIGAMEDCLSAHPDANAVGTMAGNGRTSPAANAAVLSDGGSIRGQLYALRGDFVDRMVAAGLRLPVGLYRGDGLLGAFARHNLVGTAPSHPARIPGTAGAVFFIEPLKPWRAADLKRQWGRMIRQQRGRMENAAIRGIVHEQGFAALPDDADAMLAAFLQTQAFSALPGTKGILARLAVAEIRRGPPVRGPLTATCG